mmetsp:Transcript_66304/g.154000  ORF Transcript_66304/g.154000 Transcript_66304/m.154000 type:complete len:220 (+) Transcript_66304:539-1198(+)
MLANGLNAGPTSLDLHCASVEAASPLASRSGIRPPPPRPGPVRSLWMSCTFQQHLLRDSSEASASNAPLRRRRACQPSSNHSSGALPHAAPAPPAYPECLPPLLHPSLPSLLQSKKDAKCTQPAQNRRPCRWASSPNSAGVGGACPLVQLDKKLKEDQAIPPRQGILVLHGHQLGHPRVQQEDARGSSCPEVPGSHSACPAALSRSPFSASHSTQPRLQ